MNDAEKFRHFSVINDFLRQHKDYTPSNREEYEKFKNQLLSLNDPLRNMGKGHAVWDMNKKIKELYKKVRKRFHAVERKKRSKGLVDITSPKVRAYLDEFNLVKKAANTPLPQPTPSPIEIEQEEPVDQVSCKSCFGRIRKTKKKGKKSYDEFYGGKRRRRKKKTRKKRGGNGKKKKGVVKKGIAETDGKGLPEYPYIQIDNPPKEWWKMEGGRRKKKTRKKRGKGAIQSYFAREQPQRDYTWNVAQFNGDYDDFRAAQHILELFMRDDDFRSPEEEADNRSVYQRSIIDDYHNPGRRLWETLLRWMRLQTIREEQQQFFRNPPGGPPGPPGQIATPAAGGGKRRKKKTRKKRGGEKSKKIKKLTKIFQQYPKIFPSGYFRFLAARLENHINKNTLWYRNGVVLTWIKYQKTVKKNDKCIIKPGDVKLDQIVNKNQGNGAAKKVVMQFLKKFEKNRIWLEVRANNKRAIKFYRKNGFKKVCNIKFGEIPGIMMVKN